MPLPPRRSASLHCGRQWCHTSQLDDVDVDSLEGDIGTEDQGKLAEFRSESTPDSLCPCYYVVIFPIILLVSISLNAMN